jgi:histidine triad (HIT) family protein
MSCIFCKIIDKAAPQFRVWEDSDFIAFLDINPVKAGHLMIVPRKHIDYVFDLPSSLYERLFEVARFLAQPLQDAMRSKRVGIVLEGFSVPHCHLHLIPIDTGNELDPCKARPAASEELERVAGIIKSRIDGTLAK